MVGDPLPLAGHLRSKTEGKKNDKSRTGSTDVEISSNMMIKCHSKYQMTHPMLCTLFIV